jgi:hypothetical protein
MTTRTRTIKTDDRGALPALMLPLCQALARLYVLNRRMVAETAEAPTAETVDDPGIDGFDYDAAITAAGAILDLVRFRFCRRCGCSDLDPCQGGCSWVAPDLCSACAK